MDDRRRDVARDSAALDERRRRIFRAAGRTAAVAALVGTGGAILLRAGGRPRTDSTVAVLILGAMVSTGTSAQLLGAPMARAGKPSMAKIVFLFIVAAAGVALAVAANPVIAIGVLYVLYAVVFLTRARKPQAE
jgi:hypothetical protein